MNIELRLNCEVTVEGEVIEAEVIVPVYVCEYNGEAEIDGNITIYGDTGNWTGCFEDCPYDLGLTYSQIREITEETAQEMAEQAAVDKAERKLDAMKCGENY